MNEWMKWWVSDWGRTNEWMSEMLLLDVNFSPSHYTSVVYIFSVSTCIMREVVFTVCLMYNIFSTISGTSGHPVFFETNALLKRRMGTAHPSVRQWICSYYSILPAGGRGTHSPVISRLTKTLIMGAATMIHLLDVAALAEKQYSISHSQTHTHTHTHIYTHK